MKKKIIIIFIGFFILIFAFLTSKINAMPNPWVDCNDDFKCAQKVSGITFPLKLSNYSIRAMKNMIEISYPLDEFRNVELRKSEKCIGEDISGVYTKFPINREIKLSNGVKVNTRGNLRKIFVMNMVAETGYYSAYCEQGMSKKEINGIYELIREAEEPKLPPEAYQSKYTTCELGDLVGRDVKRIKYHYYNIDYHKKDFKKEQILKLADKCLLDGVGTQFEMNCCMTIKMYGDD